MPLLTELEPEMVMCRPLGEIKYQSGLTTEEILKAGEGDEAGNLLFCTLIFQLRVLFFV
jgi:hypothetical protein